VYDVLVRLLSAPSPSAAHTHTYTQTRYLATITELQSAKKLKPGFH